MVDPIGLITESFPPYEPDHHCNVSHATDVAYVCVLLLVRPFSAYHRFMGRDAALFFMAVVSTAQTVPGGSDEQRQDFEDAQSREGL